MEKAGCVLGVLGIVILVYSLLGAFLGNVMILSFIRPIKPSTGIVLANSFLLLSLLSKVSCKKQ